MITIVNGSWCECTARVNEMCGLIAESHDEQSKELK